MFPLHFYFVMLLAGVLFSSQENNHLGHAFVISNRCYRTGLYQQRREQVIFVGGNTYQNHQLQQSSQNEENTARDDIPSMDWLTKGLQQRQQSSEDDEDLDMTRSPFIEEYDNTDDSDKGDLGDVPIPSTGVSVQDELTKATRDQFYTQLIPMDGELEKYYPGDNDNDGGAVVRAAQIVTKVSSASLEPLRYIIGLDKMKIKTDQEKNDDTDDLDSDDTSTIHPFVMIDVPPYSDQLKRELQTYMGPQGQLVAILVTSRDNIHYNEAPGVFAIRRADWHKWQAAFDGIAQIAYRMDIPRDCRDIITQRLDGYGPFAMEYDSSSATTGNDNDNDNNNATMATFVETGRPLIVEEWTYDTKERILAGKQLPPDDDEDEETKVEKSGQDKEEEEEDAYSPEAIRAREEGKHVLAIYTPGRSYGSVSYVFPQLGLVASGYTIPVEDNRSDENWGMSSTGPALDYRGYITTPRAGIVRQMQSARHLINTYADRFHVVLPSRGSPFPLEGNTKERKEELLAIVDQYEQVGRIYEQLGITNSEDDDDDDDEYRI